MMIEMQKLQFILEFTFSITVECQNCSLIAKLLTRNLAHAKHAKTKYLKV